MSTEEEAGKAVVSLPNSRVSLANSTTAMGSVQPSADARTGEPLDGAWQLDPRASSVEFRTRHLWGLQTVKGRFDSYHGKLDLSATPAVELTIDAASVQTGNGKRDRHLRSADFFDVENHSRMKFVSDSVELRGETLRVRGRLTVRGRSIPLELDAEVRRVGGELKLNAAAMAPHRELGITWSPLRMIRPHSKLAVTAHLIQHVDHAA